MGRQPDPAAQKAKGFPGRRRSKVQKQLEEAERVAKLLASSPAEAGDPLAPPAFLDARFAPALQVWRDYAPKLARTHRLQALHRLHFAMFCVYMGEWVTATEDILAKGRWQTVPTVSGGKMERTRPVVAWREIAFANAMKLGSEFGLTPSEEYALFKDQRLVQLNNPGLFGGEGKGGDGKDAAPAAEAEAAPAADYGLGIGGLGNLDSEPPTGRPN